VSAKFFDIVVGWVPHQRTGLPTPALWLFHGSWIASAEPIPGPPDGSLLRKLSGCPTGLLGAPTAGAPNRPPRGRRRCPPPKPRDPRPVLRRVWVHASCPESLGLLRELPRHLKRINPVSGSLLTMSNYFADSPLAVGGGRSYMRPMLFEGLLPRAYWQNAGHELGAVVEHQYFQVCDSPSRT
jgi:hypothetical protein